MITESVVDGAAALRCEGTVMRFELRDTGGSSEFWAFDVDARFDAAMAALARERSGDGWLRRITCSAQAAEPALANMSRYMLPLLRQAADVDPVPWQDALDEVAPAVRRCRRGRLVSRRQRRARGQRNSRSPARP